MELIIDNEFRDLIPPLTDDEFKQLEGNIICDGIRDPLVVWNGILFDGHNRYSLAQKHGFEFTTTELHFADRDAVKVWIITNQLGRRNLSAYDRLILALKLKPVIAAKAKEKQIESGGAVPQKSAKPPIETRAEIAKAAGVSHDTIAKVEKIEAQASPEIKAALSTGDMYINAAYNKVKQAERKEDIQRQVEEIEQRAIAEPDGLFDVIVIDPPWIYGDGDSNRWASADEFVCNVNFVWLRSKAIPCLKTCTTSVTSSRNRAANTHASPKNFTRLLIQCSQGASSIISAEHNAKGGQLMETTRRNSPWHGRLNVQKGDHGKELVKQIVEKCGFNCYRSVTDGAHLVDFLWLGGKKFAFAAEVKTKPKFKNYPATGFDYRHYEQYKQFTADTGIPVFIFFVDDCLKKIYGNFLHVPDEPRKYCNMRYPGVFTKNRITIRYHPLNAMIKIADLSDEDTKILKKRSESA